MVAQTSREMLPRVSAGSIADPRVIDPLIYALGDDYWDVREKAAFALGWHGDPDLLF
jgi:HEAT repeat protein